MQSKPNFTNEKSMDLSFFISSFLTLFYLLFIFLITLFWGDNRKKDTEVVLWFFKVYQIFNHVFMLGSDWLFGYVVGLLKDFLAGVW